MTQTFVYDVVNPSDAITFRATPDDAAAIALVLRASFLFVEPLGEAPAIVDGDAAAAIREAIWSDPGRLRSYAAAFRSFRIGSLSDRMMLEDAVSRMSEADAAVYEAKWHDERGTSLNDICARCWKVAAAIEADADKMERGEP